MALVIWEDCSLSEKLARWENAERVLVKLPKHERTRHWNMGHWGIKTDCGTVCCAAGHCGLDPWFRKRGLKLKPILFSELIDEELSYLSDDEKKPTTIQEAEDLGVPKGQGGFEDGVDIEEFFGTESHKIFGNGDSRSVNDVIAEIRAHLKDLRSQVEYAKVQRQEAIAAAKAELKEELRTRLLGIEEEYKQEIYDIG